MFIGYKFEGNKVISINSSIAKVTGSIFEAYGYREIALKYYYLL